MNRTQLYELAVATGKSLVAETDNIKTALAIANAAEANKVDGNDFPIFQQYVNQVRGMYIQMDRQKLPSEMYAAQKALQDAAAAKVQAPQSAPATP